MDVCPDEAEGFAVAIVNQLRASNGQPPIDAALLWRGVFGALDPNLATASDASQLHLGTVDQRLDALACFLSMAPMLVGVVFVPSGAKH